MHNFYWSTSSRQSTVPKGKYVCQSDGIVKDSYISGNNVRHFSPLCRIDIVCERRQIVFAQTRDNNHEK